MKQKHFLTIKSADIISQAEARTFKFGKARDTGGNDKLVNNVKLTDLEYERDMAYMWIDEAVENIMSEFKRYSSGVTKYGDGELKSYIMKFELSSKWPKENADGFDIDCKEYIINMVVHEFLSLSLPKEADVFASKAMQYFKNAERKLYYKTA